MYFQAAFQPQSSQEHESLALRRTDRGWKLVVELEARRWQKALAGARSCWSGGCGADSPVPQQAHTQLRLGTLQ